MSTHDVPSLPEDSSNLPSGAAYPFTFRCPPPGQEPEDQACSETLCHECAQLDLDQSFTNAHDLYESARRGLIHRPFAAFRKGNGPVYMKDFYYVTSLGTRLSQPGTCKLCNFFARMTTQPHRGSYKLLAFCSSESYLFEPRKKDTHGRFMRRPWEATRHKTVEQHALAESLEHNVFMAVVPEVLGIPKTGVPVRWFETDLPRDGSIYRLTAPEANVHRLILPRERQARVNFGLMRAWLNRCRCHHTSCACQKPAGTKLPGFRVIDCRSCKTPPDIVERPWSERYVALSYVWGPPAGDWPQTILDAVEVTKRLGERYLWVDRTCIDQSNLEEKKFLISKMDAIYEGAEFTIVCAAGDARSGLPGVCSTPRLPQPWVELEERSAKAKGKSAVRFAPGSIGELVGITEEEYDVERVGEQGWLDDLRFGLRGKMAIDFGELMQDMKLKKKYDIPGKHLAWFRDMADEDGYDRDGIEEYLDKQKELARRIGIPLKKLVPYFQQDLAKEQGLDLDPSELESMPIDERPFTKSSKPQKPLPPNKAKGKLILVSSMQEPRTTIKNSQWATRGWTYQEGVLSNRRLVFTEEQVYWECRGMAVCETISIPLNIVHEPSGQRMDSYMLSGIFDDDLHHASELQYGFLPPKKDDVGDQVVVLDGHIQAYTSRNLTNPEDSLKAFMGVAASYTTPSSTTSTSTTSTSTPPTTHAAGLSLLHGLPVWPSTFANHTPGLQHTFALSLTSWAHRAPPPASPNSDFHTTTAPQRRPQFPSWTWAGWQGSVAFCSSSSSDAPERRTSCVEDGNAIMLLGGVIRVMPGLPMTTMGGVNERGGGGGGGRGGGGRGGGGGGGGVFEVGAVDPRHGDFFKALTSAEWVRGVKVWSAELRLHGDDNDAAGGTGIRQAVEVMASWTLRLAVRGDARSASWRYLTMKKPLVLQDLRLSSPRATGPRGGGRRLGGRLVSVHLSVGMTEAQLVADQETGHVVVVLVFAGTVPFVYNGIARFLVLRRAKEGRWERIGRVNMWVAEEEMKRFWKAEDMVGALPVQPFGEDITIV
ncbi:Nn.00g058910.m01.CDS01 [Neocucurbitaria sp. VM-36]